MEPDILLARLDDIGRSLTRSDHTLALIGLGSVGQELERLDAYSDLDFFVIVEPGYKRDYLDDLSWLSAPCPVAYCFANTVDGYKALYSDGIFCEFAVFEPDELASIPFSPGRIVWKQKHVPDSLGQPVLALANPPARDRNWLLGEALTNLFVGLGREKRGEKLSALKFIQVYAVERILELADSIEPPQPAAQDEFSIERRFEQRHPVLAAHLSSWLGGYERNRESAQSILGFLEDHFDINPAIANMIRELCR